MKFISKKDLWIRPIFIMSLAVLAGSANRGVIENGLNVEAIIDCAFFVFLAWIYWGTYYRVENSFLIVKCGPLK